MTKTNMENSIHEVPPCVLIGGSVPAFYGERLLAAAKAVLEGSLHVPEFSEPSWTAGTIAYLPDFGIAASRMLSQLLEDFVSFVSSRTRGWISKN